MENEQVFGPILTEAQFFSMLDTKIEAYRHASAAYADGRIEEAKHLFAEHVRATTDIDKFFNLGGKPYRPVIDGRLKADHGDTRTITFDPDYGYVLYNVTVNGEDYGPAATLKLTITENDDFQTPDGTILSAE